VGSPGTVRKNWFCCEEDALAAEDNLVAHKSKKGYQPKPSK
jgi:predicted DNA-binding WGR domain protein